MGSGALKKIIAKLNTVEIYTVSVFLLYVLLAVSLIGKGIGSLYLILVYSGIIATVFLVAKYSKPADSPNFLRKFYLLAFVYLVYDNVHIFIPHINPLMFDDLLAKIDRAMFGCNPTEWIYQFANPWLTEILQFCYVTFFFLPIIHGIELHIRKKDDDFAVLFRQIVFGFYVSYLLYFILPAVGPRFSLHDFFAISNELPGVCLTEYFRNFINSGGGIAADMLNPAAYANRDCMPSGHTMMTIMNIWLAFKFKSKLRYVFLIIGTGLIISTVYLRYHYVIDLIAGAACAVLALKLEPKLNAWIERKTASMRAN